MNYIERDVYVLENRIKEKIDYVRGTNALPIYFHFRDYEIPEGATAKAFVLKPSKKATYDIQRHSFCSLQILTSLIVCLHVLFIFLTVLFLH